MFANMEALKTIIERRKDDVKEFSRMAVNAAKHLNKHQEIQSNDTYALTNKGTVQHLGNYSGVIEYYDIR